ncbi:MAG: abortive infection family protein [Planctomycetales bacterium]|nr:abortive infection family protein [Planctomycetales bacterium]
MAERILKMAFATMDGFSQVRNEQSLAHDNEILEYDESIYIFNHVCALVRFLQQIDPPPANARTKDAERLGAVADYDSRGHFDFGGDLCLM